MGRGSSKASGGMTLKVATAEQLANMPKGSIFVMKDENTSGRGTAAEAVKGMTGYKVQTASGDNMEVYFRKQGGETYYTSEFGAIPEKTPNNMTEREMVNRIKDNGGKVEKYTKAELVEKEEKRRKNRKESDKMLDQAYVNDRDMKQGSRSDRTGNRARRRKR